MNPFLKPPPLPPGSTGERHFPTAAAAKESAANRGVSSYAVLQYGQEFAWISPVSAFTARGFAALSAGIHVIEIGQK